MGTDQQSRKITKLFHQKKISDDGCLVDGEGEHQYTDSDNYITAFMI